MLEAFYLIIFFCSLLLVTSYRKAACMLNLYDAPNNRSAHTKPIPLGAGLTFIFILTPSIIFLNMQNYTDSNSFYLLAFGAAICTLLGFVDDIKQLSPRLRLFVQFAASVGTLIYLTNFLSIPFEVRFLPIDSTILSLIFGILFVMWMINLFNFIDGLDGLLGSQVFVYGIASFILCHYSGNTDLGLIYLIFSFITMPFLIFNWRPAKIFMGDAGAYFFGFSFAFLSLVGKIEYEQSLVAQVILMGAIISDTTFTLILRFFKSDRLLGAHRRHLFQRLRDVTKFRTSRIVAGYLAITLLLLFPLSYTSILYSNLAVFLCFFSYAILLALYVVLTRQLDKLEKTQEIKNQSVLSTNEKH